MHQISIRKCRASGRRKKKSLGISTLETGSVLSPLKPSLSYCASSSYRTIFINIIFRNDRKYRENTDGDNDNLTGVIENYIGTSPYNKDGDTLTDFQEING